MLGFASDQIQAVLRKVDRGYRERRIARVLRISSEECKYIVNGPGHFGICGEKTQVGIDSRGSRVVIPRP